MVDVTDDLPALAALASGLPSEAAPAGLRERVLASAGAPGRYGRFADRLARLFGLSLEPAQRLLADVERGVGWQPSPWPGLEMLPVDVSAAYPGAMAGFLRLAPGVAFPRHGHVKEELTLVLEGGLVDSDGREVWRGEELHEPAGTEHSPVALDRGPCITATIAYGGILLGRKDRGEPRAER